MGPGVRTLENLECPECGVPRPVMIDRAPPRIVHYDCPTCLPHRMIIGCNLPGLPSDLSYLRAHGRELIETAIEAGREEVRAKRAANEKAEALLQQHLSPEQLRSYQAHRSFDVRSCFTDRLSYRIEWEEWGAFVSVCGIDTERSLKRFVQGMAMVPHLGSGIREAAARVFREKGSVRLCLRLLGPPLPVADSALALKLFVEANESRTWIKGMRYHLGLAPEPMTFGTNIPSYGQAEVLF